MGRASSQGLFTSKMRRGQRTIQCIFRLKDGILLVLLTETVMKKLMVTFEPGGALMSGVSIKLLIFGIMSELCSVM